MPKRRSGGRVSGCTAKRRRHLYLAFDDWSMGYSIRKLDLSSDSDSDDADLQTPPVVSSKGATSCSGEQRLPPAIFRLVAQRGLLNFAAAFGTKIMAIPNKVPGVDDSLHLVPDLVPVYDVGARGVIYGPPPEADPAQLICIPVGDRLFALAAGSMELLYPPPLDEPGGDCCAWSWRKLPKPPFKRKYVTSYAMHPDGRTLLVSIEKHISATTFTFDTEEGSFEWKQHGNWMLPFTGRAHFDRELDAWVGLPRDNNNMGHICSCDVVSATSHEHRPALKLSKENLFSVEPVERHIGATLLYMGAGSKFCLVHCIEHDTVDKNLNLPRRRKFMFRVTTFSLKYDKNGNLTTGNSRRVRNYKVPTESTELFLNDPVAFWL